MKLQRLQQLISEQLFGRSLKLAVGTALVLNIGLSDASAQTWAPAASANWNDTLSWTGGIIPVSGNTTALTFGGSTAYTATNDIGAFTLNSLTVGNTDATTIDGGAGLTFAGTTPAITINSGSGATTISGPITYSVATAIANNSGSLLTFSGTQALDQNLTFSGTGATTITGATTFTAARTITNDGTGLLTLGAVGMGANPLTANGTGSTTISGVISGSTPAGTTALTKSGSGTLRLSGVNTFTGNIAVSAGTLELGAVATVGAIGKTISLANNTTVRSTASYSNTGATGNVFSIAANSTATFDIPSTLSLTVRGNYLIGATGTLNKIGSGTLGVGSGGTSNVQTMNIQQGILRVTSNRLASVNTINISSGAQFLISDNGALNLPVTGSYSFSGNGPSNDGALMLSATSGTVVTTIPSPVTLTGDSMINVAPAASTTGTIALSGNVSGPGGINKIGTGRLQLGGANNTYGGPTNVRDGVLLISGGSNRIPVTSSLTLGDGTTDTSGTFDLNGQSQTVAGLSTAGAGTANSVLNNAGGSPTFTVDLASGSQTYAGILGGGSGSLNFAKSGAGNLSLSGANTYTGSTTVAAGTLSIANSSALSSSSNNINVTPGAVLDVTAVSGGYSFGASQVLTAGRTTAFANDIVGDVNVAGTFNIGGSSTAATATISGNSNFNTATFQFDLNNIPASGNDRVAVGGNLAFTGMNNLSVTKLNGNLTPGNYTLFTYAGTLTGDASNFIVSGAGGGRQSANIVDPLTTPGSVQLSVTGAPANLTWMGNIGSNIWDKEGAINFTGAGDNRFFNDDTVTFNNTGVGGATPVLVTGALSPSTMTVAGSQNYTFNDGGSGSITGTGNIALNSTGTVTLGVPVTTVGTTTLSAGTLTVATGGSIAGPVAISGGNVNVVGSIAGPVTISSAGTVMQIGNGGTEGNVTGSIALVSGSTLAFSRSDALLNSSVITGSGNIANNGIGEVTLATPLSSGNYNFTGSGAGKLILSGNISGTATLTQSGPGTLRLSGANTFASNIVVNAGALELGDTATAGASGNTISLANNTTVRTTTAAFTTTTTTHVFSFADNSAVTFDIPSTGNMSLLGNHLIGPTATLNKIGDGQLNVGSSGTATVQTMNIQAGVLRVTSNRLSGVNAINISAGAQFLISDDGALNLPVTGSYSLNGNGPSNNGALMLSATAGTVVSTIPSPVTLAGDSMINVAPNTGATGAIVLSGDVSGPGGIIKTGTGALQLSGLNNTYGGPTIVRDGALQIAGSNRIPVTSTLTLGDDVTNTSGAFDLNGNSQTVAGLATAGTGSANTVGNTGTGTPTFTVALATGSQNYGGLLGGGFDSFNFTKSGAGALTLSGTSTYTGTTTVNAGTLAISTAASLPSNTAPVTVASGAVLDVSAVAGGYSFITGRTVTLGRTTTPANDLVGSASIAGSLNLGGTNTVATTTISGDLTFNSATVNVDLSNSLASGNDRLSIGGNLTANGLTTIFVNQTGSSLAQGNYTLFNYTGTLTGNASNFALAGSIASSGTRATYTVDTNTLGSVLLNVNGTPANLTWVGNAGNNAWDLLTTSNFTGAPGAIPDNRFFNADSVTFNSSGIGDPVPVNVTGALLPAAVTVSGTQGYTFSGTGSIAASSLTKDGTGSLALNVPVTSASTTVNAGTLTIGTGGSVTGPVAVTNGTLNGNITGAVNGPLTMTGGTTNATVDGAFTGSVAINGGTFIALNPTGTAINNTSISVAGTGVLQIGNGGIDGSISDAITLSTGGTLTFNRSDAVTFGNGLTINGNSTILNQGTGTVTRDTALAVGVNTLTLGGTGNLTLGATVSGTGQIIKNDAGTVTLLANNNAFTGTVTINAGTLILNDLGAGGDLSASLITVNSAGKFVFGPGGNPDLPGTTVLTINGGEADFQIGETYEATKIINNGTLRLTGNGTVGSSVESSASVGPVIGFELESGSIISTNTGPGTGSLLGTATIPITKTTSGTIAFTGPITYTAAMPINLQNGVLDFQADNLPTTGSGIITLGDTATNGTLRLSGSTSASTARPFALANGGGTIEVVDVASTLTVTGAVTAAGTGQLTKTGLGTLALTGANTYTGGTTISAGTLQVGTGGTVGTGNVTNNASFDVATPALTTATIGGTGNTTITATGANLTADHIRQAGLAIGTTNTVTVAPNGGNSGVSQVTNLTIGVGGKLDLKNNDLVVPSGSLTRAQVETLVNSGALSATGILTTSASGITGLGTAQIGETIYAGSGSYGGLSAVNADTLVKYTYLGDADLSGSVDFDDYAYIDAGFFGGGNRWAQGDFDNNGVVDFDDYAYIDGSFFGQGAPLLSANISAVPEPSTWVLGSLAMLGLAGVQLRRRKVTK